MPDPGLLPPLSSLSTPQDERNLALSALHLARPQRGGEGKKTPTPQKGRASSTPSLNFHQGPSSPVHPPSFVQSLALKHHIFLRSKDTKTGGRIHYHHYYYHHDGLNARSAGAVPRPPPACPGGSCLYYSSSPLFLLSPGCTIRIWGSYVHTGGCPGQDCFKVLHVSYVGNNERDSGRDRWGP